MKISFKIILYLIFFICVKYNVKSQSRVKNLKLIQFKESIYIDFTITKGNSCLGFTIQQSNDSINFSTIYEFIGICGELTKEQDISYTYDNPSKNIKNYYRVFIPPADYSEIKSIDVTSISIEGYLLYDNPFANLLKIKTIKNSTILIFNSKGEKLIEYSADIDGMINQDISFLDNGLYMFLIKHSNNTYLNGKFIKSN
jgi:hypothetical protein